MDKLEGTRQVTLDRRIDHVEAAEAAGNANRPRLLISSRSSH
jgi:hypothetical protein